MKKVFIIAEAGVNHNGDLSVAKLLVEKAAEAGADAVKFQTFKATSLVSEQAEKAGYQKKNTNKEETQFQMLKRLELDYSDHIELIKHCEKTGIRFMSSAFDPDSIDLLKKLGINIWKIPSGEITNLPYLRKIGQLKQKVILSTGMSDLSEIGAALEVLKTGGTSDITVLHCNTEYPTPFEDVNLTAMLTIKKEFGVKIGYSDHTLGTEIPIAAAALGAEVIEKHFTLNKNDDGPDHSASLEPSELKAMVKAIRNIEKALGDGIKKPSESELKNRPVVRKSIVAACFIKKGERFSDENITVKRPANGISPMKWDEVIGKTADKDFNKDEPITL